MKVLKLIITEMYRKSPVSDLNTALQLFYVCQLFTSNLVTRSASAENAADTDRSVADVEQTRIGAAAERHVFDPSESMLDIFRSHLPKVYMISGLKSLHT